jgi:hypothetical protein
MSVKEKMLRERSVLIALAAVVVVSLASTGAAMEDNPFRAADYAALRKQLRAFYPDWGQGNRDVVKDPRSAESYGKIEKDLKAWCAAHPVYDALDVRRECYMAMRRHFVPFLFTESLFYFEAGVNGGWGGKRPARIVNKLCWKFYKEKGLVPDEAFETLSHRRRNNLVVICGPFVDDLHHVPPMRRILKLGFKGVRDEVAAALEKCPADDAKGRKELETALVGLETIRQIQLKFHEAAKAMGDTRMVEASARCPWEPPRTFYESLNTLWFVRELVGYVDGVNIFSLGRPDAWFIDAYRREIAAGTLTEAGARVVLADDQNELTVLLPGEYRLQPQGFSVFSMTETVNNLTLSGVQYPLSSFLLTADNPLCVSNRALDDNATLSFTGGILLLIYAKD